MFTEDLLQQTGRGAVLDAIPDPILVVDREVVVHGMNRAARQFLGPAAPRKLLRCGELLRCLNLADPQMACGETPACPDCVLRSATSVIDSDQELLRVRYNMQILHDGVYIPVVFWVTASSFKLGEEPLALLVLEDVTELVQLEDALKRSNAELEQFAFVASHDLQEPLRMVTSFLQLLQRRYEGQLDKSADTFISHAVDGAERMRRLLSDLLKYSRLSTQGLEPAPTSLEDLLDKVLDNLRVAVEEEGARVTHDPLPEVQGDPGQLMRLLQNLISNAIKFHGDAPPEVHIGARRLGEQWEISVRDNGIGIHERDRERIFGLLQRLHTREEYNGTGIGLTICKKIVQSHGGEITVQGDPGEGTTFVFTLPARQQRMTG